MSSVISDPSGDDWATIRIKKELKQDIEKVILIKKRHGVPVYNSVADFVHSACIEELERNGIKKKEAASAN